MKHGTALAREHRLDHLRFLAWVSRSIPKRSCGASRRSVCRFTTIGGGSLSAELSARIMENVFYDLDAPVARVCSAEVPIPYLKHLEDAALPQVAGIVEAVHHLVNRV